MRLVYLRERMEMSKYDSGEPSGDVTLNMKLSFSKSAYCSGGDLGVVPPLAPPMSAPSTVGTSDTGTARDLGGGRHVEPQTVRSPHNTTQRNATHDMQHALIVLVDFAIAAKLSNSMLVDAPKPRRHVSCLQQLQV